MEFDRAASDAAPLPFAPPRPTLEQRAAAIIEVLLCSDYPTQLVVGGALMALGYASHSPDGGLRFEFVALLSLADTALLIALMLLFFALRGDRAREVFFGGRPVAAEVRAGLPMIVIALLIAAVVMVLIRTVAPQLHNVELNPLQQLLDTPTKTFLFAIVAVIAGGVREELQRAFLLNRFERWLGGGTAGLVVASVGFGLGHWIQGIDAAIATGTLGAFWASVYLRRRSVVAPIVSHSGFNLLQLAQLFVARS